MAKDLKSSFITYDFPQLILPGFFLSTEVSWEYIFAVFRQQSNPKTL